MNQKLFFLAVVLFSSQTHADYRDDIGYRKLQAESGIAIPEGNGVRVTQVEAAVGVTGNNIGAWMLDVSAFRFSGKNIIDRSTPLSAGTSSHATGVANLFFGNTLSMAPGIVDIEVYSALNWLMSGFLKTGSSVQPLVSTSRIANHSWVGTIGTNSRTVSFLERVDWLVEQDEFIQVIAMNNGSVNRPLLGGTFNSIAVGLTDARHAQGSISLGSIYTAGRARPDVVVPVGTTSSATPVVSASAAMLIEQAHTAAKGLTTVISNGDVIYNGERSEVVKAVIMAGADRVTKNTATIAQIINYRAAPQHHTDNGLDSRYGAGQLNVNSNFKIMAAGEQNSLQDGGATRVDFMGFDYDASFGGTKASNNRATYSFNTTQKGDLQLTASLVWNIDIIDTDNGVSFRADAVLYDLDLFLYDVTGGIESLLASSTSKIDNTENLWYFLEQGRDYQLQVLAGSGSSFNWDYGLAWKISAVPVPATVWFFSSGILVLLALSSIRKQQGRMF